MIKPIRVRNEVCCMILRDDDHLHIDEQDPIAEWLVRSMRIAQTGNLKGDLKAG